MPHTLGAAISWIGGRARQPLIGWTVDVLPVDYANLVTYEGTDGGRGWGLLTYAAPDGVVGWQNGGRAHTRRDDVDLPPADRPLKYVVSAFASLPCRLR